jgi:hypothetical protein
MKLSNKAYDFLKWFSLIFLNAFGTFYATIGAAWGLPYIEEVKTTCFGLGLFIGACIGISTVNYNKEKYYEGIDEERKDS